ncbi:MAG: acetylornithine/N-succinyldiaminopimelate aminotransferase [Solirubrobacterales bacterium]|jgi:predicted acetylornithine/succinylornithine family transaminase|nr:acetylornithine/N-succinyldiaminopimelate aminotransferase [Solirubrobacterales bacterium]
MTNAGELRDLESRYTMPTYLRAGVEFVRGEGTRLWDSDGKEYLDFFAGLSVHNAGHCHPRIVAAITEQAGRFNGSSNLFLSEPALRLAERISETSLGGKVFLTNSGAEASECAIKLARKHAHGRGIETPRVVSLDGGFHGRTIGALAATPKLADEGRFGPLPRGFDPVARDDADALRAAVTEETAAVMIEPIQGEAGIFPVSDDVLVAAREACDATGALLVLDEVQTGMGRTGSMWAFEQLPVKPDVMTAAKALGGGLPVGAVVTTPELADTFEPGDHGSTFAGGPVGASAALAALDVIGDEELLANVQERGAEIKDGLEAIDGILEVRGRGLMIGMTLADGLDAPEVRDRCLDAGLVINCPGPGMLRLLPPLILTSEDAAQGLSVIAGCVSP